MDMRSHAQAGDRTEEGQREDIRRNRGKHVAQLSGHYGKQPAFPQQRHCEHHRQQARKQRDKQRQSLFRATDKRIVGIELPQQGERDDQKD